jgi:DNA invertase Pin-like site-specific DNA recombinase
MDMTQTNEAVAYMRVSTAKQGLNGLGMEAQNQIITEYAIRNNLVVCAEFIEVESGKRADRVELARAIEYCKKYGARLIIAKLDRLSRSVAFISNLLESKIDFIICDNPNANKMTIQMIAVFAEYERDMISQRTKDALRQSKKVIARGIAMQEHDSRILDVISELKEQGINSYNGIAGRLKALGLETRTGGTNWDATRVRNIVLRHAG